MSNGIGGLRGRARRLPSALEKKEEVFRRLSRGTAAVFLDYDGTLTPIVAEPSLALLPPGTREIMAELAGRMPVAVLSGRALPDIKVMVGLDGIFYSGSHGFSIEGPGKSFEEHRGGEFIPAIGSALEELQAAVAGLPGVKIEAKPLAVAVHYRQADNSVVPELESRVAEITARHRGLRKTYGKKIFEVRPDMDWDKGKALLYLAGKMGIAGARVVPLYIGDDVTDEDAFRAVLDRGVGILVSDRGRPSAASYRLKDPQQVAAFLRELSGFMRSVHVGP